MKASVLRLLLTGGLFTQDVVTRHKQSCNTLCDCALGGVANIRHVSWECSHYSAYGRPLLFLSQRLQRACPCFLYAAILTESDRDLLPHIVLVQSVLVDVWRAHIKKYLYNDLGPDPPQPSSATSSSVPRAWLQMLMLPLPVRPELRKMDISFLVLLAAEFSVESVAS